MSCCSPTRQKLKEETLRLRPSLRTALSSLCQDGSRRVTVNPKQPHQDDRVHTFSLCEDLSHVTNPYRIVDLSEHSRGINGMLRG